MKKSILLIFIVLFSINLSAQETKFGINAGYANMRVNASSSVTSVENSENASGFYVGALVDFHLSGNFHLQPAVNYLNAEDANFLSIPVMAQLYISESQFYLQAGPQATFILDDNFNMTSTFGLDAAFGAGYHITRNFFLEARYAVELTNRTSKELRDMAEGYGADISMGVNALTIGVGYKF